MKARIASTLFVTILFYSSQSALCQDFIVTTKGDSLKGKVKLLMNSYEKMAQVVSDTKKKSTVSIMKIRTVTINNERFDPIRYGDSYTFMKLIKGGYLSLYGYQLERQTTYDGQYLLKMDGKGTEVPNLGFKRIMSAFLNDCEDVSASITKGTLNRGDLMQIIDDFNACILKRSTMPAASVQVIAANSTLTAWTELENSVQVSSLQTKADALEMIGDIKSKLSRGEKLPKFLVEGLKESLGGDAELTEALNKALATTN